MSSSPEPEFMQSSVDSSDGSEPGDIDGSGNYQENDENGEQTEAQDAFKGYENQFDAERGISDLYGSAPPQPHPNNSAATLLKRKAEDNADSPSKQIRSSSAKPHVNVLDSAQRPRQAKAAEEESPFWPKAALRNSQTKFKRQSLDRAVDAMGGSSKLKELFAIGDAPNSPQTHTSHNTRNTQPFIPENSSHTLDVSSAANEVKEEEDNPFYQTDIRDHEPEIAYQEPRYESDSSDDPDTVTAAQHEENSECGMHVLDFHSQTSSPRYWRCTRMVTARGAETRASSTPTTPATTTRAPAELHGLYRSCS